MNDNKFPSIVCELVNGKEVRSSATRVYTISREEAAKTHINRMNKTVIRSYTDNNGNGYAISDDDKMYIATEVI